MGKAILLIDINQHNSLKGQYLILNIGEKF